MTLKWHVDDYIVLKSQISPAERTMCVGLRARPEYRFETLTALETPSDRRLMRRGDEDNAVAWIVRSIISSRHIRNYVTDLRDPIVVRASPGKMCDEHQHVVMTLSVL